MLYRYGKVDIIYSNVKASVIKRKWGICQWAFLVSLKVSELTRLQYYD